MILTRSGVLLWAALAFQGGGPSPQDAIPAIVAAFDRYDIVGMNAAHSNEKQDELILSLVQAPAFLHKVNDIVVECGNSKYQALLDEYIGGGDVSFADARRTWRDTSVRMCALSGFYDGFFPTLRALNVRLPENHRVRVLVSEPPGPGGDRDAAIASIVTAEVLAKHRKALLLCGVGHLFHNEARGTAVSAYEKAYPGRTFVIDTHIGFAAFSDLARGRELEARMRSWPVPSLVAVKGSWLADLDLPYFLWPFPKRMAGESYADLVDAYLYLGPATTLTYEPIPESILDDAPYIAELSRRFGPIDVDGLRRRRENRALFTAVDLAEAHQFAPGAEYVGAYAAHSGDAPAIEIDFRRGVLSARLTDAGTWTPLVAAGPARFMLATANERVTVEFDQGVGAASTLTLDRGSPQLKTRLARQAR